MSNLIFPTLSGLDIKIRRTPVWSTEVLTAESGKEQRAQWWSAPRYRFQVSYNFLRQDRNSDELASIEGFFHRCRGQFDSFLFTDPKDSSVTDHGFGVGDGTTTAFQLQRTSQGQSTDILGTWPAYTTPRANLCLQSQTFDTGWSANIAGTGVAPMVTANWTTAPDGTPTADRVTFNQGAGTSAGDYSLLYTPAVGGLPQGQAITVSIWAKSNNGATQRITLQGGSVAASSALYFDVTPTWQRFTFTLTAAAASGTCGFGLRGTVTSASTADVCLWGMQIEAGSVATSYIPTTSAAVTVNPAYYPASGDGFEPITELNGAPAIYRTDWQGRQLLYPTARTNYLLQSQNQAAAGYGKGSLTVTAGVADPAGGTNAFTLTATGAGAYIYVDSTVTAGTFCSSAWIRRRTGTGEVRLYQPAGVGAPVAVTSQWQRLFVTGASNGAFAAWGVYMVSAGDAVDVAFGQVEPGNTPTSYIPTTTAAVTRTDYTLSASGMVTFAVAPVSGASLTWTGSYFYRVRFEQDEADFEREFSRVWGAKTVKLVSVK